MNIVINGEAVNTDCETLAALLRQLEHAENSVATALNGEFVPAALRTETALAQDDVVEIVAPMSGG